MTGFLIRRAIGSLFAILGVSSVVFVILHLTSDPAALLVPQNATEADYARIRETLGLDKPLPLQYLAFLSGLATGNFGNSYRYGGPALEVVLERVPATLMLASVALLIAITVAVPVGVLSAVHRRSSLDRLATALTSLGQAMPSFWLGPVLIVVVAVTLRWLPTSGGGTLAHVILPAITLAIQPLAQFARITRSEMIESLSRDYVRTAHSKGLAPSVINVRHALRNAAIPLVTLVGLSFGTLLSGAIITETIFGWPGVGRLMIQSIAFRDFPVVQTAVVLIATIFVAVNFAVDVVYSYIDPRIRLR